MTRDEAKVRIRLDTKQAKGELRSFLRSSRATAGRVGSTIRGSVGRSLGLVGLGGVIGAGVAAIRAPTATGAGDIMSETLGYLGHQISQAFFGDMTAEARASRYARDATLSAYSHAAGQMNATPPGAVEYYNQLKSLREVEETGRNRIMSDPRFNLDYKKVLDRLLEGIKDIVDKALDAFLDRVLPWWLRIG
jgi:hypothetical protein